MALLMPNVGEEVAIKAILNHTAPQNWQLRLYQNDITPSETDTAGTYTQATFTGYGSIALTGSSWTVTPGAPTTAAYAQQTFTSTAGSQNQGIYGYYCVQVTSGILMIAERFSSPPWPIQSDGDQIKVTPNFTLE